MSFFLYLLHVTIAMGIFYSFYRLVLQRQTTFNTNRYYLISSLAAALIIPLIRIYYTSTTRVPVEIPDYVMVGSYLETTIAATTTSYGFSWIQAAIILYGSGVLIGFTRLFIDFRRIMMVRKNGEHHLFEGSHYILSDRVVTPYSFFNTIYLPASHGFSDEELKEVMKHENAHIIGRHSIDILLMEIMTAFFWVNPMIYLYRAALREVHEFLADADVIRTSPWDHYAELLIAQKGRGLQNRLSNQLVYSQLKKRLIMMTQKPSSSWSRMRYLGFIPLILVGIIILSFRQKHEASPSDSLASFNDETFINSNHESLSEDPSAPKVYNIYKEGLKIYSDQNMPLFPGCDKVSVTEMQSCSQQKLIAFISNELVYPSELKTANIEGVVIVKFVVDAKGIITGSRVEKSLHPAADQAALDLIRIMREKAGKWTPATKEGKAINMEMVLPISFKLASASEKDVYTFVEEMPSFGKSTQDLYEYIYNNIRYPKEDRENKIEGQVIVQFTVGTDGMLSDAQILRGVSPAMNAEVIRIIEEMNQLPEKWTPGRKDGKPVAVRFTLPVKFVIEDEKPEEMKIDTTEVKSNIDVTAVPAYQKPIFGNVTIYPNPATGILSVDLVDGAHTLRILDQSGRVVLTREVSKNKSTEEFNIRSLAEGPYILQVIADDSVKALNFMKAN